MFTFEIVNEPSGIDEPDNWQVHMWDDTPPVRHLCTVINAAGHEQATRLAYALVFAVFRHGDDEHATVEGPIYGSTA